MPLVTLKEFAEKVGIDQSYASKLKKRGVLDKALVKVNGRKIPKVDLVKGKRLLKKNLDPNFTKKEAASKARSKNGNNNNTSFSEARTETEIYKAAERKLNLEIKQGQYLHVAVFEDQAYQAARIFRDSLLNIGPRIAAIVAVETDEIKILEILNREFKTILKELFQKLGKIN